ncbi:uncharacterized protein LOC143282381 [Babylonia areolata]|uniref:uncharacterized protein LOC143282381 n=1 Tax=Babylonia areolata TaxID=304850 RepID=UPI003FCFAA6E
MSWITLSTVLACLVAATWQLSTGPTNLLQNPSFEDGWTGWSVSGFKQEKHTDDVRHGTYSLKVFERKNQNSGPSQSNMPIKKGGHYGFEAYVKLLNDVEGKLWQTIKVSFQFNVTDDDSKSPNGFPIVYRGFCNSSQGWIRVKGDVEAPMKDFVSPRIAIRGPDGGVDFLVDNVSLIELPEDPQWRQKADANIERLRKSNITITANVPEGVPASEVEVEVALKNHKFAFGCMLRDDLILQSPPPKIMKIAYSLFDWATVQNYKWKFHKGDPLNNSDLSEAINMTNALRARGFKVRGHSIFWNHKKNIPEEVHNVSAADTTELLQNHLKHVMSTAKGLVAQWDVQNEHITEHYYEEKTGDADLTKKMFRWAEATGDTGKRYLNDFQCVTSGAQTEQMYDLVKEYLAEGVPIEGIGIQGHTKEYVKPDPTSMWRRLDRLGELNIPVMMTEFDLGWHDALERADWFEDAIRAFFAHPTLHGVILWDLWNHTMRYQNKGLVVGVTDDDLEILEPGQRYACLVRKEWNTNQTFQLSDSTSSLSLRGFQGDYQVVVKRDGKPVQKKDFVLGTDNAAWTLDVTSSTDPITVETREDYVPQCISHREQKSLGQYTSTSTASGLNCSMVRSSWSGSGVDDNVSVSCPTGEVMTACMSFQKDALWKRNGEKIEVDESGAAKCVAYNGHDGSAGVKAWALCCKGASLQCEYQTAGPSFPMDGAMAEATCPSGKMALGCSSYSSYPVSDGVRPVDDLTACRAQSGAPHFTDPKKKSGVLVYSACCKASSALQCTVESSSPSELSEGSAVSVACPANTVITGCNAFAEDGKAAGAKILNSGACFAKLGATLPSGSTGVRVYATCCSV